jgi:hypothetical protein
MADTRNSKGFFSQVIDFFASVKLAIVILIALAATSASEPFCPRASLWKRWSAALDQQLPG